MCYICNCFAWTLDLFQRGITFCLTCCMTCVICAGLIITIIAGIAFGYNYSFAEFITYTPADVTVYMRRGQFYDHPDIAPPPIRRMGDEDDLFAPNMTAEYEEQVVSNNDTEPLSDKWLKDEDAREYAMRLTKYKSSERKLVHESKSREKQMKQSKMTSTAPSTRRLSGIPIVIQTTVWRSDSSEIVLRKFLPLNELAQGSHTKDPDGDLYRDSNDKYITRPTEIEFIARETENIRPDIKIRFDDVSERDQVPLSDSASNSRTDQDDFIEEESEDNMYKPVK